MIKRQYKKILRKVDAGKFQKLKGHISKRLEIATWNLWGQFGITHDVAEKRNAKGNQVDVSDYAWTQEAKEEFDKHHSKFIKALDKRINRSYKFHWVLNVLPCDYKEKSD